jgi:hypothetical protein
MIKNHSNRLIENLFQSGHLACWRIWGSLWFFSRQAQQLFSKQSIIQLSNQQPVNHHSSTQQPLLSQSFL